MKNATKEAPLTCLPATELTSQCNTFLSAFFCNPENGAINMPNALKSSSCLPNGNIILIFKYKDDAIRAHIPALSVIKCVI